jgi:hypothetical protein
VGVLGHRRMVVIVLGMAFGLTLVFALSRASSAASPNGVPPEPSEVNRIEENLCAFPVLIEGEGKIKDIFTGDGSLIEVAPGFTITMSNLEEPDNQITVTDTAAWNFTPLANGGTLFVGTGQFFVLVDEDLTEELQQGIYLAVGRTTWVEDAEGTLDTSTFRNDGQLIDVCATLA